MFLQLRGEQVILTAKLPVPKHLKVLVLSIYSVFGKSTLSIDPPYPAGVVTPRVSEKL